jgi:hypothetical protein
MFPRVSQLLCTYQKSIPVALCGVGLEFASSVLRLGSHDVKAICFP